LGTWTALYRFLDDLEGQISGVEEEDEGADWMQLSSPAAQAPRTPCNASTHPDVNSHPEQLHLASSAANQVATAVMSNALPGRKHRMLDDDADGTLEGDGASNPKRPRHETGFACPYRKRNARKFNCRAHWSCISAPFADMAVLKYITLPPWLCATPTLTDEKETHQYASPALRACPSSIFVRSLP
jgi:hypothetical protein